MIKCRRHRLLRFFAGESQTEAVLKNVEFRVDVGSMRGRCRADVGSMWGRCRVDVGSM